MLWITYKTIYGKEYSPVERDPNSYTDVTIFTEELPALRYANLHGAKCVTIFSGQTLEEAIRGKS